MARSRSAPFAYPQQPMCHFVGISANRSKGALDTIMSELLRVTLRDQGSVIFEVDGEDRGTGRVTLPLGVGIDVPGEMVGAEPPEGRFGHDLLATQHVAG